MTSNSSTSSNLRQLLSRLVLPHNEILYLHVQLKGLVGLTSGYSYTDVTQNLINSLNSLYKPKAILVPTFTYSFTKKGVYDRVNTASEVGRFSEEVRTIYSHHKRTMNPVFSVVDITGLTDQMDLKEDTAFGVGSLMHTLHEIGYITVNINTPQLISTYFHYLEAHYELDYRFSKFFSGKVSKDGKNFERINYEYYVRNTHLDTSWRRDKIQSFLLESNTLHVSDQDNKRLSWFSSYDVNRTLGTKLLNEPHFMITNENYD